MGSTREGRLAILVAFIVVGVVAGLAVPIGLALTSGTPLPWEAAIGGAAGSAPASAGTASTPGPPASTRPGSTSTAPSPTTAPTPRRTPDTRRPTIVTRTPSRNATGVGVGTRVRVTFSEPVRNVSANTARLVNGSGGWTVNSSLTYSSAARTLTIDPALLMYPDTVYRVEIGPGITDLAGNALAPVSWTFRTAPG